MEKIKCVAYCRVSTDSKDQENSLENQKSYFEREINSNTSYEYAGIYADKGISGTKLSRPEFDKMLIDAGLDIVNVTNNDGDKRKGKMKYITVKSTSRKPKFNRILVKNSSRFARNILVEQILRDLADNKVYVYFLDSGMCTEKSEDMMIIHILLTLDERESVDKSKKINFGIEESARRGNISVGSNIFGYEYIQEENSLRIIEEEAKVVREIFELYSNNIGVRRIVNELNRRNIKTKKGSCFCQSSIKYILENEKYTGVNIRRKRTYGDVLNKDSYPKLRPKNEWLDNGETDKIPPIISKELFYKCKQIKETKVNYIKSNGIYNGTTEYAKLIYCGKCGQVYIANTHRGRRFYNCKTKRQKNNTKCNNPNISIKELEEATNNTQYIAEFASKRCVYVRGLKKLIEKLQQKINNQDLKKVEELKSKKEALEEKRKKCVDLNLEEYITKEELIERLKIIDYQINELDILIIDKAKNNEEIYKDIQSIKETIDKINSKKVKIDYTKAEILQDIEKIIIHEDKEIEVIYKSVQFLKELKEKHDYLRVEEISYLAQ